MDYRFPFLLSRKKERPRKGYKKITLGTPSGPETAALESFLGPVGSGRAAKHAARVEGPQAGICLICFGHISKPRWLLPVVRDEGKHGLIPGSEVLTHHPSVSSHGPN